MRLVRPDVDQVRGSEPCLVASLPRGTDFDLLHDASLNGSRVSAKSQPRGDRLMGRGIAAAADRWMP